ncbi:MAG: outer membrane protein transport protein [Bacteroidetes bacterium]|nr:outer membrane protein transport protein [Bacteroidota bacterium]
MKKTVLMIMAFAAISSTLWAGGIVTNSNQSAAYVRMLARDASYNLDAVYFNPAGLTLIKDGFHFSLNTQTIWQDRSIKNDYKYLNNGEYKGKVFAPVFPSIYAAYKTGKTAFSAAFIPVGGGGGATFDKGLPSFEIGISDLVPSLNAQGIPVSAYSADLYFKGTSVYWGAQLGVSTELTDNVSLFIGARYIMASTTYQGHLKDITLYSEQPVFGESTSIKAADFFAGAQLKYQQTAAAFGAALDQSAVIPEAMATQAGLPVGTTFGQATAIFTNAAVQAGARKALLSDQEADVTQKGTGITPIFGMNISLLDKKLNIGAKYEFVTPMLVKNNTKKDFLVGYTANGTPITEFPDKAETHSDMPCLLSIGVAYKVSDKLNLALGYHGYFDKSADYGKTNSEGVAVSNKGIMDKNYFEIALGAEYNITKKLLVSAGILRAQTGVSEAYQSDLSNSLSSNTGSFGFGYNVTPGIQVNVGALYTTYVSSDKHYTHYLGKTAVPVVETYGKGNVIVALGVDVSLGK